MKRLWKENVKVLLGIIIGLILASGGVHAVTTIMGSYITYSNVNSGLSSTNVQGAIDELYNKVRIGNFVEAYTYNQTSGASNYCVTGKEETCQKTMCYKNKTENSCPVGTIIRYRVNDTDIVNFHVMRDNGSKITMQSQRNTINETSWISKEDYIAAGGTNAEYGTFGNNKKGPLTVLTSLENATSGWSNVNNQIYTLGTNTGCSAYNSCTKNTYTLGSRTAKARLITLQEAASFGCNNSSQSCPIWMYNYLNNSTNNGGTENDSSASVYWSSSAYSTYSNYAWYIMVGRLGNDFVYMENGARAVVEVTK